jgi:uncharacterized membrane protein
MPEFTVSVEINKPKDIVEQAFFNPENMPCWTKDLVKVELVKGKAGEAGSVARLHYVENGRSYVLEDRLEYREPGKKIVSQVSGSGMLVHVETTMESSVNQTRVSLSWSGKGTKFPLNVILPFMGGKIKRSAMAELETFKRLVETYGAVFPENTQ